MPGAGPAGAPRRRLAGKGPAAKTAKTVLKKPAVRRRPAAAAGEGEAGPPLPPAVVLNLERRQDRWDAVGRRLEPLGLRFRRWAAVDGVASSPAAISTDLVALRWSTARNWEYVVKVFEGGKQCGYEPKELPLTGGERGCAASHAAVWRHVAEGVHGGGPLVVLEDDAKPTPAFASRLPQALAALREEEPDVLFLGYTQAAPWRRKEDGAEGSNRDLVTRASVAVASRRGWGPKSAMAVGRGQPVREGGAGADALLVNGSLVRARANRALLPVEALRRAAVDAEAPVLDAEAPPLLDAERPGWVRKECAAMGRAGLKKSIEALLAVHVPSWKSMPVAAMAEYLGVWIGPAANMEMWSRMFREWVEVVHAITKQQAAPSVAIQLYNSRAVSKFSYLCQLAPLPKHVARWESWALHKVLHLPSCTFPLQDLLALRTWAKVRPLSLKVQATATLWRAAAVTIKNWRPLFCRLQKKARTALPIVLWTRNCWSPPFWQRRAFVQELAEAAAGFVENDWLRAPVARAKIALKGLRERLRELHYCEPVDAESAELVERILGDLVASIDKLLGLRRQEEAQAQRLSETRSELGALELDNPQLSSDNNALHLELIDAGEEALQCLEPFEPRAPTAAARGGHAGADGAVRGRPRGTRRRRGEQAALRAKAASLEEALDDCAAQVADLEDDARRHEDHARGSEERAAEIAHRLAGQGPSRGAQGKRAELARLRREAAELRLAVARGERAATQLGGRRAELTAQREAARLEVARLAPSLEALQGDEARAAAQAQQLADGGARRVLAEEQQLAEADRRADEASAQHAALAEENAELAAQVREAEAEARDAAAAAEARAAEARGAAGAPAAGQRPAESAGGTEHPAEAARAAQLELRAEQVEAECLQAGELQASLEAQVDVAQASLDEALARCRERDAACERFEADATHGRQRARQMSARVGMLRASLQDLDGEHELLLEHAHAQQGALFEASGRRWPELREGTRRLGAMVESLDGEHGQRSAELERALGAERRSRDGLATAERALEAATAAHARVEREEVAAEERAEVAAAQRDDLAEEVARWAVELREESRRTLQAHDRAAALRGAASDAAAEADAARRSEAADERRAREELARLRRATAAAAVERARLEALRSEGSLQVRERAQRAEERLGRMQQELEQVVHRHGGILEEMEQADVHQHQLEAEAQALAARAADAEAQLQILGEARARSRQQLGAAEASLAHGRLAAENARHAGPLRAEAGELTAQVASAEAARDRLGAEVQEALQQLASERPPSDAAGARLGDEDRALTAQVEALRRAALELDEECDGRRRAADLGAEEAAEAERRMAADGREAAEARQAVEDLRAAAEATAEQLQGARAALAERRRLLQQLQGRGAVLRREASEGSGEASTIMDDLMHMTRENQSLHEEIRTLEDGVGALARESRGLALERELGAQQLQALQLERDDVGRLYHQVCQQTRAQSAAIERLRAEGDLARSAVGAVDSDLRRALRCEEEWQAQSDQVSTDLAVVQGQVQDMAGRLLRAEASHREALQEDARLEGGVAAAAEVCRGSSLRGAAQHRAAAALRARRQQLADAAQRARAEAQAQRAFAAEGWEQARRLEALLEEGWRQLGAREEENEALRAQLQGARPAAAALPGAGGPEAAQAPADAGEMRAEVERRYAEVGELDAEQSRLMAEVLVLRAALRQRPQ
ncbi:unnamed protein product [Prorocentrum cordatum]|uniref:Glycosyl transferase family 25 domain-containing protein n=1 Tax=Prorocentrum cordatum TaxID=2364126 RepID=A0ABN9SVE2_9DINO|nr:unnamed protein product [Polarella glacialis]